MKGKEERFSELGGRKWKSPNLTNKLKSKCEQSHRDFWDFNRRSDICVISVWEGEGKEIGVKKQ